MGLTPKGTAPYNRAMHPHIVAHVVGGFVTLILLAVGLVIGVPIALIAGPLGLLAVVPFVLVGAAVWGLAWIISNGLTTTFQLLRHWLGRFSGAPKLSGQRTSLPQLPRRREAHWFGAAITVVRLVVGLVIGGIGIAIGGTAIGLPAAIPLVLVGLAIWRKAWTVSQRNESLETSQRTLPPDDRENP